MEVCHHLVGRRISWDCSDGVLVVRWTVDSVCSRVSVSGDGMRGRPGDDVKTSVERSVE